MGTIEETESISAGLDYQKYRHYIAFKRYKESQIYKSDEDALNALNLLQNLKKNLRPSLEYMPCFFKAIKRSKKIKEKYI